MDRRSWLWRRKSSDKSPAETDSSAGSFSSHSERFCDDQIYPSHRSQSPEVTSKALPVDVEINNEVKTLTEKLSAALLNISVKEDLVKQHAKVAEEAVSGWEEAEKELLSLKQQLEAAIKNNSGLEDRVGHLDAALKECVRQLRQAREEQDQRIKEAVTRNTCEWESVKSELEKKIDELQAQLQTAKSGIAASADSDLQQKLEASEKDNSSLKQELPSQAEELEIMIMERDLSIQAAETASKQHLESIKKVVRLEAECSRLKSIARKVLPANELKIMMASSISVESLTDSLSDIGERQLISESYARRISGLEMNKCEPSCSDSWGSALISEQDQSKKLKTIRRNFMFPSLEIDLMDDFLEMERLAALDDTEGGSSYIGAGPLSDQVNDSENLWNTEHGVIIQRTAELEQRLEKLEEEKIEIQKALTECQRQLEISESQLKEADAKLLELQSQKALAREEMRVKEEEIESIQSKKEVAESQLAIAEVENRSLISKVGLLGAEVEKEQALSAETLVKCQKLEDELSKRKCEAELQHEAEHNHVAIFNEEMKIKQEKELAVAASKYAECQKTISSLGRQLKALAAMEDFLQVDSNDNSLDFTGEGQGPQCLRPGGEQWKLQSADNFVRVDS